MVLRVGNCALNTKEKKMRLRYITCSDPREHNDIHKIVDLGRVSPRVEIAVQAHPSKMSFGMPRNQWFRELLQFIKQDEHKINLALHVNREWCDEICRTGKIPPELKTFFDSCRNFNTYDSLVARWQLNIPVETVPKINVRALKQLINSHPEKRFIIQYNDNTRDAVEKLYDASVYFSVLYDASGGRGISPKYWRPPLYLRCPQGYSGGMSPENVADNLDKIAKVAKCPHVYYDDTNRVIGCLKPRDDIWIDAEGKLKTDDKFDIVRARQYVLNAENWLKKQR